MGNYTILLKFKNPRRGRQARNFSENDPKILDLKSSSEQIIFRKSSLGAPDLSETVEVYHEVSVVESVDSKHGLHSSTHATDKTLRDFS